jgi:hypothetical protein
MIWEGLGVAAASPPLAIQLVGHSSYPMLFLVKFGIDAEALNEVPIFLERCRT